MAFHQQRDGRRGEGQFAVRHARPPREPGHRRRTHLAHAEPGEPDAGADDVDERVDGPDLVEVDVLGSDPVDAALRLGQQREGAHRVGDGLRREALRGAQDPQHVGEPPVGVRARMGLVGAVDAAMRMGVVVGLVERVRVPVRADGLGGGLRRPGQQHVDRVAASAPLRTRRACTRTPDSPSAATTSSSTAIGSPASTNAPRHMSPATPAETSRKATVVAGDGRPRHEPAPDGAPIAA